MFCGGLVVSFFFFFFSSRRRHTRLQGDWSSDVCSSDLVAPTPGRCPILLGFLGPSGGEKQAVEAVGSHPAAAREGDWTPSGCGRRDAVFDAYLSGDPLAAEFHARYRNHPGADCRSPPEPRATGGTETGRRSAGFRRKLGAGTYRLVS